jgi:hypothetical protein
VRAALEGVAQGGGEQPCAFKRVLCAFEHVRAMHAGQKQPTGQKAQHMHSIMIA